MASSSVDSMADMTIRGSNGRGKERNDHDKCGHQSHEGHARGHDAGNAHNGAGGATGGTGADTGGATGGTGTPGGTTGDPTDRIFQASFRNPTHPHFPGMPIFIAESSIPGGITTVQQTDIRPGPPQFSSFARAHGMIIAVNADKTVQVQSSG